MPERRFLDTDRKMLKILRNARTRPQWTLKASKSRYVFADQRHGRQEADAGADTQRKCVVMFSAKGKGWINRFLISGIERDHGHGSDRESILKIPRGDRL